MLSDRLQSMQAGRSGPLPQRVESHLQGNWPHYLAFGFAAVLYVLLAHRYFISPEISVVQVLLITGLALVLMATVAAYLSRGELRGGRALPWTLSLKLGLFPLLAVAVFQQVLASQGEILQPLNYLLAALLYAYNTVLIGGILIGLLIGLEWLQRWLAGESLLALAPAVHTLVTAGFALAIGRLFRSEYKRRRQAEDRLQGRRHGEEDILRGSPVRNQAQPETSDLSQRGVERLKKRIANEYEDRVTEVLGLMRQATHSTSAVLLRYDEEEKSLRFWEGTTVLEHCEFNRAAFPALASMFAPLFHKPIPHVNYNWDHLHASPLLPYFQGKPDIRSLRAWLFKDPKELGTAIRGVLVVDSVEEQNYAQHDPEAAVKMATGQIHTLRELQAAQLGVEQERQQAIVFKQESERLNDQLSLEATSRIVVESVCRLFAVDAALLALKEKTVPQFKVIAGHHVREGWDKLVRNLGKEFGPESGVVGPAMLKHFMDKDFLLATGDWTQRQRNDPLFDSAFWEPAFGSALAIPLLRREEGQIQLTGCLTLLSSRADAFTRHEKTVVATYANMVASALENARKYEEEQAKATTDGLTGLHNHRYFQEWMDRTLAGASRYPEPLALLLTDIDKFKKVNDTWGHPAGDAVLKKVARILAESARDLDLAARYGGEEFVVVLRQTDPAGAKKFAERVRKTIEKLQIQLDTGEMLRVTLSIGIACFPGDAKDKGSLIEMADQGLYYAKEHGRNQVVSWTDIPASERQAPVRKSA